MPRPSRVRPREFFAEGRAMELFGPPMCEGHRVAMRYAHEERQDFCLVCGLKRGTLLLVATEGGRATFEEMPSEFWFRGIAELIQAGLMLDYEEDGRVWFPITRAGVQEAEGTGDGTIR